MTSIGESLRSSCSSVDYFCCIKVCVEVVTSLLLEDSDRLNSAWYLTRSEGCKSWSR